MGESSLARDAIELLKVRSIRWSVGIGLALGITVGVATLIYTGGLALGRLWGGVPPPKPPIAKETSALTIVSPGDQATVAITKTTDGSGSFEVSGTASSLPPCTSLYLVVRSTRPVAREWWVMPPVELHSGSWKGDAYIGNAQYPPLSGNRYSVAAVIAPLGIRNGDSFLSLDEMDPAIAPKTIGITAGEIR